MQFKYNLQTFDFIIAESDANIQSPPSQRLLWRRRRAKRRPRQRLNHVTHDKCSARITRSARAVAVAGASGTGFATPHSSTYNFPVAHTTEKKTHLETDVLPATASLTAECVSAVLCPVSGKRTRATRLRIFK